MYLNPVEASADSIVGRRDVLLCRVYDLVDDESLMDPTAILERNSPGAHDPDRIIVASEIGVSTAQPSAHNWRKMKLPILCTASIIVFQAVIWALL
tara:strand:- start:50554 stop:50841 length:288 start_codon:yes stop_codon:yes gene_type:complete